MATQTEQIILSEKQITDEMKSLEGWSREGIALKKDFEFASFLEALAFVNRIAAIANEIDHHPDIFLSYTDVTIRIWTHKKKAVTTADVDLAKRIQALA